MDEQVGETKDKAANHPLPMLDLPFASDMNNCDQSKCGPNDIQHIERDAVDFPACREWRHIAGSQTYDKDEHHVQIAVDSVEFPIVTEQIRREIKCSGNHRQTGGNDMYIHDVQPCRNRQRSFQVAFAA